MVYTYDKLDITTNATVTRSKSRQSVTSLRKEGSPKRSSVSVLDPSATSFIPKVDHGAFTDLKNI